MQQENINQEMIRFAQMVQKSKVDDADLIENFQKIKIPPLDLNNNNIYPRLKEYLFTQGYSLKINCYLFEHDVDEYAKRKRNTIDVLVKCEKCKKNYILDFDDIKAGKMPKCSIKI